MLTIPKAEDCNAANLLGLEEYCVLYAPSAKLDVEFKLVLFQMGPTENHN